MLKKVLSQLVKFLDGAVRDEVEPDQKRHIQYIRDLVNEMLNYCIDNKVRL